MIDYRTCFNTSSGRIVLTDLLMEAGFFDTDLYGGKGEEVLVENFAKKILYKLGIYDVKRLKQQQRFVDKLFELPVEIENEEKKEEGQ
jgi:hypothetical protein